MSSFFVSLRFWLCLCSLCCIWQSMTVRCEDEVGQNFVVRALNGYAAIMNRIRKIHEMYSSVQQTQHEQEYKDAQRHQMEQKLPADDIEQQQQLIEQLLEQYGVQSSPSPRSLSNFDNYYIPVIDELFGFNDAEHEDAIDPVTAQQMHEENKQAQHDYIRRRLQEDTTSSSQSDALCNNENMTSPYDTDYKFMFVAFDECNLTSSTNPNGSILHTTSDVTNISLLNTPILYSPNCEFVLVLNGHTGQLQVLASQQTFPVWTSSAPISNNDGVFSAQFDRNTGDLTVWSDGDLVWQASNTSHWQQQLDDSGPFVLRMTDTLGEAEIVNHNEDVRWFSFGFSANYDMRYSVYVANLTDSTGNVVFSMAMEVRLLTHKQKHLYLSLEYVTADKTNLTEQEQAYMSLMLSVEYKFNVSVYKLSSNNIGDQYVVYDPDLPMIYSLIHDQAAQKLSISESHTFLCIDNQTRYFAVELLPFEYDIAVETDEQNYTLHLQPANTTQDAEFLYHENDQNYTLFINPWNPCNEGKPVLAQKRDRECYVKSSEDDAIAAYHEFANNDAYSNVNMKYVFQSPQCVDQVLSGNRTLNDSSIVFPANFTNHSCESYIISVTANNITTTMINPYFTSTFCSAIREECGSDNDGFYQICLDYVLSLCTCYCPRDKQGSKCQNFRDYSCKLNIVNANMTECELMTQEELNQHGRDDYDVTLDGDKPCFFIDEQGDIESVVQLHCYFDDGYQAHSQTWEELVDYDIFAENVSFTYCLGNDSSPFALTKQPPLSTLRLKIFNFARIFNDDEAYSIPLTLEHWSGHKYVYHTRSLPTLNDAYKVGGRIYIEYQLWQMDDEGNQQNRINVERRFYDIDHWQLPPSDAAKLSSSQKWFIAISVVCLVVMVVYCIWQCNKWCQKLEHEKND